MRNNKFGLKLSNCCRVMIIIVIMILIILEVCIITSFFAGDILVFMPGQEDIEVTCETLKGITVITKVHSGFI